MYPNLIIPAAPFPGQPQQQQQQYVLVAHPIPPPQHHGFVTVPIGAPWPLEMAPSGFVYSAPIPIQPPPPFAMMTAMPLGSVVSSGTTPPQGRCPDPPLTDSPAHSVRTAADPQHIRLREDLRARRRPAESPSGAEAPSFASCKQQRPAKPIEVPPPVPGDTEPGPRHLIVNYLPAHLTSKDLFRLFSVYGEVEVARVVTETRGRSIGYGFVFMRRHADAVAAIEHSSGRIMLGKRVRVSYAIPQRPVCAMDGLPGSFRGPLPPSSAHGGSVTPLSSEVSSVDSLLHNDDDDRASHQSLSTPESETCNSHPLEPAHHVTDHSA